uniref:Ubiquitinyl hydrolase 1 n=1 Tax=Anisakis simplex TaxID=6269 RepID=A0A0M3JG15_ANISI
LASSCFVKIVLLSIHSNSICPEAIPAATKLIQNEITKSESRLSPQQLFLRKKAHICKYLAKNLLDVKFSDVNLDENGAFEFVLV